MDFDRLFTLSGRTQEELDRMSQGILALANETNGGYNMKLAVVDLDGVIANNEARFAKAEEAKLAYLNSTTLKLEAIMSGGSYTKEATDIFWKTAFTPELVKLDKIIPGAKEDLETLRYKQGYTLLFLTSRPDAMYEATMQWLIKYNILFMINSVDTSIAGLVMKAPAFQYVKTTIWKAGMVQTLAVLYGVSEVLFIDDEGQNIEAVTDTWNNANVALRCCSSLELAVNVDSRRSDEM